MKRKTLKQVWKDTSIKRKRAKELNKNKDVRAVLNFTEITDGKIATRDTVYYFLGIYPQNERLMTRDEKIAQKKALSDVYNNFSEIVQFSTDLPYSLKGNKDYLESQKGKSEPKDEILEKMQDTLNWLEQNSENSIKRFYYVFNENNIDIDVVKAHFEDNNVKFFVPLKEELEKMLRSYILLDENNDEVLYYDFNEYIDTFLPAQIKVNQDVIYMAGKYRKTIFVKNYPTPISEFYLARLSKHKNVNVTIRAIEKVQNEMVNQIVKTKTKNIMNKNEGTIKTKMFAEYDDKNIDGLFDYMQDTQQKMWDVSIYIEIVADSKKEIERTQSKIETSLKSITTDHIHNHTLKLFQSANPLHKNQLSFVKRNMPTESFACLNNANYSGHLKEQGIFLGTDESGGLIFMDLYERNDEITNGHFSIISDSGQGKSYLAKKILYQLYCIDFDIISIDNDREYTDLTDNCGGDNVDVLNGQYIINPLEIRLFGNNVDDEKDNETIELKAKYRALNSLNNINQHVGWFRDLMLLHDNELTTTHLDVLEIFLVKLYQKFNITEQTDLTQLIPTDYPILSDLYDYLIGIRNNLKENKQLAKIVNVEIVNKLVLTVNTLANGSKSTLLNGYTKVVSSTWINLVLQDFLDKNKSQKDLFFFNTLTYIWSEQVKHKKPTVLFTDEFYLLINKYMPVVLDYFRMFIKRGRKFELYIGYATQNLNDFRDPEIFTLTQPLFGIPKHKFIGFVGKNELDLLKPMLKLTDGEIGTISTSQRGKFLFIVGNSKYKLKVVGYNPQDRKNNYKIAYENALFGEAGGR